MLGHHQKLKDRMKILILSAWALASIIPAAFLAADAHSLLEAKKYPTPWFSSNWLEEPVTNVYLAFHESREYTTLNAIKSEIWRVREVRVGHSVFWTTLERKPV